MKSNDRDTLFNVILYLCAMIFAANFAPVAGFAEDWPQWSVHELTMATDAELTNPYTDIEVTADLTGPEGQHQMVRGFWNGGRVFNVRFTPMELGEWKYSIRSTPADPGLTLNGSFVCTPAANESHGFLRRDVQHPTSFVYDDGSRYFMFGTTYYAILANARAGEEWKKSITNIAGYGMNKVRMHLHESGGREGKAHYAPTKPFLEGDPDRIDPDHWKTADRVIRFMADQGIVADLILFPYRREKDSVNTRAQDERYLRYSIARFAAFPNVQWCLVNEWNYSVLPQQYWNEMGQLIRREDPWSKQGDYIRALTIHQQTRPDWNFSDETWPSHADIQLGVRNRGVSEKVGNEWKPVADGVKLFTFGDDWGNHSIARNWTGTYPIVNDEYGYIGEPSDVSAGAKKGTKDVRFTREKHRRTMWGIAVGGGYLSAGDKNDYSDGRPYYSAAWHDVPEYGDIKRLVDFFTAPDFEYWKMAPRNDLVQGNRVYALAELGKRYVIYAAAGDRVTVTLAHGQYASTLFDPKSGETIKLSGLTGAADQTVTLPDSNDWVIDIRRSGK